MPLPDFIIVGTCKSGSTSLHQNLRKHPDLYTPSNEVHYFYSRGEGRYDEGIEWYRRHFVDAAEEQTVGEKTPMYAYMPECPARMQEVVPDAKLVWIFRDPVRRAHSHYWYMVNRGEEPLSFEQALKEELDGKRQDDAGRAYLRTGLYGEQVERYLEQFDSDAMFFCTLRELKTEPVELLRRLYAFLGVDPGFAEEIDVERQKTTTHTPYSPWLRHFVISRFGGQSLPRKIEYKLNSRRDSGYPEMTLSTKRQLCLHYASSNQCLRRLINRDLQHWHEPEN